MNSIWLMTALILLTVLCSGILTKNWFKDNTVNKPKPKTTKPGNKWNGPKTDARINKLLAECITLLKEMNVPISNSICPTVKLIGSRRTLGRCCKKGSRKKYSEYDYYIEISGHTLGNTEKSLRNTIIHELIHTVPDGFCHTGEWKKWAKYVNSRTDYKIQRLASEEQVKSL
jgi:hypothetical protein